MNSSGSTQIREQREFRHRTRVLAFFQFVQQGEFRKGLRFFSQKCRTHNPYVAGTMPELITAMEEAYRQGVSEHPHAVFSVEQVLVDGDFVAAHTHLLSSTANPMDGGLRQVHLFRFEGEEIVEYWDITQEILPNMPNAAGAF